jgi:ABC-2 type transport system permease protein
MGKVLTLAWLNLQQLGRDRSQLIGTIAMPLILTLAFGMMLGGGERKVVVALADADHSRLSAEMAAALPSSAYDVRRMPAAEASTTVADGKATAALIIPKGFGASVMRGTHVKVVLVKDPVSTTSLAVSEAIKGAAQRMAGNGIAVQNVAGMYGGGGRYGYTPAGDPGRGDVYDYARTRWQPKPPVSVRVQDVQRSSVRGNGEIATGFSQYSLGFTVTFMVFIALAGASGFLEERELGTFPRLLTTPTGRGTLISGKILGIFVTTAVQATVMVGVGIAVFKVPWGNDMLGVAMVLGAHGLAATGLGVMLSTLVRSRGQLSAMTSVLAIAMAMLGGCYWPIEIVPPAMRTVAMATPNYWAMQGLLSVVVRNQGTMSGVVPAAVLLGFTAVFFAVGLSRLRFE